MTAILKRNRAAKDFSRNPKIHLPRSVFYRPWNRQFTNDCSYLIPICCKLVNPGETWKLNLKIFSRLATQFVPVMDTLKVQTFFFFDPCRLLWDNWTKFMGEKENPNDNDNYIVPGIQLTGKGAKELAEGAKNYHGTIYDYLRAPLDVNKKIVALPYRMYNHIYNSYFRSENLQDSVPFNKTDADDSDEDYQLLKINKTADWITSGLKQPQAGEPVQLPLGTTAPVIGNGMTMGITDGTNNAGMLYYNQMGLLARNDAYGEPVGSLNASGHLQNVTVGLSTDPAKSGLVADLSEATASTVQALRQMIAMQEILERDNRNGTRYTEILEGRYGVSNPDLLLYRPQYLGGTMQLLGTNPVVQTSATDSTSPQGNIAGYGVVTDGGNVINASFGEFGYIMGLMCVTSEPKYQKGCDRMYTMFDKYDYMYPELYNIGDEAITNGEVYCQGDDVLNERGTPVDDDAFCYSERYGYYKQNMNEICGKIRSDSYQIKEINGTRTAVDDTLDAYTYAENWTEKPNFNGEFLQDKTIETVKRSIAVQDEPQLITAIDFQATVYSPLPVVNIGKISSMLT